MEYLIVGLGNPGKAYANTRHNAGFLALQTLADKLRLSFREFREFRGLLAKGKWGENSVSLLFPDTYMNGSGESVRAYASYYDVPFERMCVVCDDIYLPFGRIRMKAFGGSGGHNGLKSIDAHLGTSDYPRLRIGVGDKTEGDLADHVLSNFLAEEREKLPSILERVSEALECFVSKGITEAMQFANVYPEEKTPEKKLGE